MVDHQGKLDFNPRIKYIDRRDIRTAFALPSLDEISGLREQDKPFSPDFNSWTLFRSEPMTHQTFTSEDFDSDVSSVSSGGSHGQPLRSRITRGSRVHHIPILVIARDDSSGYSSDSRSEESKPPVNNEPEEDILTPSKDTKDPNNDSRPQTPPQSSAQQEAKPKESTSESPTSPPPESSPHNDFNEEGKSEEDDEIDDILGDLELFTPRVKAFSGSFGDQQYKYLERKLDECTGKLDEVDTKGREDIRERRKSAAKEIGAIKALLKSKANP